jgi:DNA primase
VVGYAPPGWTALTGDLRSRGYTDAELLAAGLAVTTRRGTVIDRFRDRIMFGLHHPRATSSEALAGFIGRAAPGAGPAVPKYLNSPRTVLFDKSRILFGLAEQRQRFAQGAVPVLVEGPMDALAVATSRGSASDRNDPVYAAVATCGTALTKGHLIALASTYRRVPAPEVVVAFDNDDAGRRASRAAYPVLAAAFSSVRGARLPPGDDPADLAATDPVRLTSALSAARPLLDDLVDQVLDGYEPAPGNAELRVRALREATQLLAGLGPREVSRQVARAATRLGFPVAVVTEELTDAVTRSVDRSSQRRPTAVHSSRPAPRSPQTRHRSAPGPSALQ